MFSKKVQQNIIKTKYIIVSLEKKDRITYVSNELLLHIASSMSRVGTNFWLKNGGTKGTFFWKTYSEF